MIFFQKKKLPQKVRYPAKAACKPSLGYLLFHYYMGKSKKLFALYRDCFFRS